MNELSGPSGLCIEKYHGNGNDFWILLDLGSTATMNAELARRICDPHRGLGADGVIRGRRCAPGGDAVIDFELWNADGSSAEMSGNGMRCLAHAALEATWVRPGAAFGVSTPAGRREVIVERRDPGSAWARVEMGDAVVATSLPEASAVGPGQRGLLVDMGNPHLVVLGADPATVDIATRGAALQATWPSGINVEFATLGPGPGEASMRVWERGVGETLACGTGACAVAVALHHWKLFESRITVHQRGGDALVEVGSGMAVALSGPSQRIAGATVDEAWMASLQVSAR